MTHFFPAADLSPDQLAAIEHRTQEIGRELFASVRDTQPHIWQRRWWDEKLLAWTMRDEQLKVQLFRFVDVLPMLHSAEAVTEHLQEYLADVKDQLPAPARVALGIAKRLPFTQTAVARAARLSARDMARRFIAGETRAEVVRAALDQRRHHRAFTLDILGEAVLTEREAEQHFRDYLELLENLAPQVAAWPADPLVDQDDHGSIPRLNLSVKLSALDSQFDALDPAGTLARVGPRLRELFRTSQRLGAFINVDMESYEKKDLTLHIFRTILMEPEFRDWTDVGIVLQCYLSDTPADCVALREWAARRGTPVWVRLVKGAYWDLETIRARANGWPVPVFEEKWQSDVCYEEATQFVLQNRQHLQPALASHNIRSLAHGIATARVLEIPPPGLELQMLYGMADAEKQALTDMGYRVRVYMPFGDLLPGMAYLVRRLLENTSNNSFLRLGTFDGVPAAKLLENPNRNPDATRDDHRSLAPRVEKISRSELTTVHSHYHFLTSDRQRMPSTFRNQPPVDFTRAENRASMQQALAEVREQLGNTYLLVIAGQRIETTEFFASLDPSRRSRVVGKIASAEISHAEAAVKTAKEALPGWSRLPVETRANHLRSAANIMRRRLFELAAWEVYECGKTWREATADVDEAIDFCEYYAEQAEHLQSLAGVDVPGEENRFEYLPRGVTVVIAPWNFPLAILTGMTVAALVTGNTVVMKPAETSSVIGALLMQVFEEAELPASVLNYLPGRGEVIGPALVEHPDVALIAFTGSRKVGLEINARAAEVSQSGLTMVKRVIAELGGKNAIIVAEDADLDEAVSGVVKSAFGFQGQKCSACSRAVVLAPVYDQFLQRIVEATKSLKLGPAEDPSTAVGPVIDEESAARIRKYIEVGKQEARLALGVDATDLAQQGSFVGPHIFADVAPHARIAQEEIFGPVLAVIKANDLTEALHIANGTDYALTGGCFSRSPETLDRVRREFLVGNLYLNRAITGAMVCRQPFGGFKMSGIGSKAGGADYLLQFVLPRTITEHTVRRGFAPPTQGAGE
jgi:RHH-type proline utilization regulon transcriptional repressor/proline dehydrogenase/delta 1-pyrroline-5-carboxylate dehydrogenase